MGFKNRSQRKNSKSGPHQSSSHDQRRRSSDDKPQVSADGSPSPKPRSDQRQKEHSKKGHRKGPPSKAGKGSGPRSSPDHDRKPGFPPRPGQRPPPRELPAPPRVKISEEAIAKSRATITGWLNQGAQLREAQNKAGPKPPQDPKTLALDPWQQQVFDFLRAGESVVVDAPTTAGKTRAVEVFFAQNIDDPTFRAAYTTPVKSLSNDKVRELRAMFGKDKVGISTGDIKENLDAPIVVATLESYRNSLLGTEPDLGRTLVIFDEYHYLQDEGRGSAWEEALILTPPSCQVLLLSASVGNSNEFADWVSSLTKRRCTLVQTLHRPVPLANLIFYGGAWLTEEDMPAEAFKALNPNLKERPLSHDELVLRLPALIDLNLAPCILYAGKRIDCENLAIAIEKSLKPLPPEQAEKIGRVLMDVHAEVGALSFIKPSLRRMIQTYGVAFHHSGLAPAARIAIERLVKDGLLRFCVATMGLSLGINFSVRSALISDYQRPGEGGMTNYAEGEVLQMLGRAGRRGKDVIGLSMWPTLESFVRMGQSKREPCNSRLRTDPTTILGLVGRGLNLSTIEGIYNKSFLKFQHRKTDLRLIRKPDVENKLGNATIPCVSPAADYARFEIKAEDSLCLTCAHMKSCHEYVQFRKSSRLASMHLHLHRIGCLTKDEHLTPLGSVARYFPQNGGLLMSRMIVDGRVTAEKLVQAAELMAALCLPRFKEPGTDPTYKFPFDRARLEKELEELYPLDLFPEMYDQPYGRRTWYQLRDWNPEAGWIIRQWLTGMDWQSLVRNGTTEYFGVGDLMGLIYRIATFMQSMAGMGRPEFRETAPALRREILRSPLDLTL